MTIATTAPHDRQSRPEEKRGESWRGISGSWRSTRGPEQHVASATVGEAPAVSVVLATYNGERFLEPLLESLARQTIPPRELVVGDDGSTDRTVEIVSTFGDRAPFPVSVTSNRRRLGFSDNFLTLADAAAGPLIAFCDQDDVWHPTKLQRTSSWFRDPEIGLVLHRTLLVDETLRWDGRHFPPIRKTEIRGPRRIDPWLPSPGLAIVVRRSLLEQVAGWPRPPSRDLDGHPMDHDEWAYLVAASLGKVVLLAEDLAQYRQHFQSYLGAPPAGLREELDRGLRFGAADYLRPRAEMYHALAKFWDSFAAQTGLPLHVARRASASANWYRRLHANQRARASAHDSRVGRLHRAVRLLRLVAAGVYRSPMRGGAGTRALLGDAMGLVGQADPASMTIDPDIGQRIVRARAQGQPAQAVAAELTRDGVPPPYGRTWSVAMVRDVGFRVERDMERAAAAQATAEVWPPAQSEDPHLPGSDGPQT